MKVLHSILFVTILGLVTVSCKNDNKKPASDAGEVATVSGVDYNVATTSKVFWEGGHPVGTPHNGDISISEGTITAKEGKVVAGNFTIDMNTINVLDLEGGKKAGLEKHLKGTGEEAKADHFFNIGQYPTAKFEINKVTELQGNPDANALVYGNLTIKGITKEIQFKANIAVTDNDVQVTSPKFNINRTDYGIKFMSGSFTDGLKDKAINDELVLNVNVTATK